MCRDKKQHVMTFSAGDTVRPFVNMQKESLKKPFVGDYSCVGSLYFQAKSLCVTMSMSLPSIQIVLGK